MKICFILLSIYTIFLSPKENLTGIVEWEAIVLMSFTD